MYLPQYHRIAENDKFWGEGFTDWVSVKNAKPLFKGHNQPRVPLNNNYYDLSQKENIAWQAKLAKEYGIYGFGIYHYWFNNNQNLLTKPAEIIRDNDDIDINYFFAWDNISWKRSWSGIKEAGNDWAPAVETASGITQGPSILVQYIIGEENNWKTHFNYLRPFFKDKRYIKIDNKPVFIIFHKDTKIDQMCSFWNKLAQEDDFDGIFFIFRYDEQMPDINQQSLFKYEPQYSSRPHHSIVSKALSIICDKFRKKGTLKVKNYDTIWSEILLNAKLMKQKNIFHSGFVSYDDTPRRSTKGTLVKGSSPEKFKKYLSKLIKISLQQEKKFIFLTAWNEWGEGAYLEPDTTYKYDYLKALKETIDSINL